MGLLDASGRPIRRRRLPKGLDLFLQLPQVEALSSWEVGTAKATALSHSAGQFQVSARMYYAMLTDPRIADGCDKRGLALRGLKFKIVAGPGRGGRTVAKKLRRAFGLDPDGQPTGPNRVIPHQVAAELHSQALLLGQAVAQPDWSYTPAWLAEPDGWFYPRVRLWHPQLTYWLPIALMDEQEDQVPGQLYAYGRGSVLGEPSVQIPIKPGTGQWMVFSLAGDQKPWLFGKMLAVWRPWISRLQDLLLHFRFNDVHGMPIRGVKMPMGMRKTEEGQKFYDRVINIGRDASLLMPQSTDGKYGVGVELIEAKSESWKSLESKFLVQGREITICITGGTQNTEAVGGNYKGAEEQREIRHEVKAADGLTYGAFLNEQLCVPFAQLNGYGADAAPQIVYDVDPPRNRKEDAAASSEESKAVQEAVRAWDALRARGCDVPLADYLAERGLPVPASAVFSDPPAAPAATPPGAS